MFNTTKPPMDDIRVRKAFNMAIDKVGAGRVPARRQAADRVLARRHLSRLSAARRAIRSIRRARAQLLAEAGYRDASGNYDPSKFPVGEVEISYNTTESNRQIAEFVQAQWKQNLGLTVPLQEHGVEDVPRLSREARIQGRRAGRMGRRLHGSVHVPRSVLDTTTGDNGTGWCDPKYVAHASRRPTASTDPQKRYELLAKAEAMLLDAQPVIPLYDERDQLDEEAVRQGHVPESR